MFIIKKTMVACCIVLFTSLLHAQNNTLDFYLNTGLSESPLLKDYQNQIAAYGIDSAKLKATYQPQVTASSNNSYAPVI